MATIRITDSAGLKADLEIDDKSAAASSGLRGLESKASEFVTAGGKPLDQTPFHSAAFGGDFGKPNIAINATTTLAIKEGINTSVTVYRSEDGPLFDNSGASPDIAISKTQAWVRFEVDTSLDVSAGVTLPSGFGVGGELMKTRSLATYVLIEAQNGQFPTLKDGVQRAVSELRLLRNAADVRGQDVNTVCEWDVSGTFSIEGSYSYPFAVDNLCLASAKLPLNHALKVVPDFELGLTGTLSVTGDFRGRCYRVGPAKIQLGLYKKKETDLTAAFDAQGGIDVKTGKKDLVGSLFRLLPGADLDAAQVPAADREAMETSLKTAIQQGLSVALNSSCSASVTDEVAVLYEIDLTGDAAATDAALEGALKGNWTLLSKLPAARELRNVLTRTHETKWQTSLNLLGLYDYGSVQDFVRQSTILHNLENGQVTITDRATAQRISAASAPFTAQDEKLRKVLDESFLATVAYSAANAIPDLRANQSLLIYNARTGYPVLKKNLLLGIALQLLAQPDLAIVAPHKEFKYFRLSATASFAGADALRLFFSDVTTRSAYREEELKHVGRQVLISLLDPENPIDAARRQALGSDAVWSQMEQQKFPSTSPASYSDWYDIATWAHSVATVAPRLKAVLDISSTLPPGDPTTNPKFMAAREALAKSIAEVTRGTHAAFEKGWPIAVMFALCGRNVPVTFQAQWDGEKQFDKSAAKALTA